MLSEQAEFAEHLFREGYPLWTPDPYRLPNDREGIGLKIGDVGAVDESGHFDLFFNICEPRRNDLHDTLPGFTPIEEPEVTPNYQKLSPRYVVSSPQTRWTIDSNWQPNNLSRRKTVYRGRFSTDGAHIILPHGADQYELTRQDRALFENLARQHGHEWYRIARDRFALGCDPLYLITGFYKTCSWALASFQINNDTQVGVRCEVVEIDERKILRNESFWQPAGRFQYKIGPAPENEGRKNQSVFISGIVITPNERVLKQGTQTVGLRALFPFSTWFQSTSTTEPTSTLATESEDIQVTVERFPQKSSHPGDVINRFLLAKEPSAAIAVTHDAVWMKLVEAGQLSTIEDLERRLEEIVGERYSIQLENGVVSLSDTVLTNPPTMRPSIDEITEFVTREVPERLRSGDVTDNRSLVENMDSGDVAGGGKPRNESESKPPLKRAEPTATNFSISNSRKSEKATKAVLVLPVSTPSLSESRPPPSPTQRLMIASPKPSSSRPNSTKGQPAKPLKSILKGTTNRNTNPSRTSYESDGEKLATKKVVRSLDNVPNVVPRSSAPAVPKGPPAYKLHWQLLAYDPLMSNRIRPLRFDVASPVDQIVIQERDDHWTRLTDADLNKPATSSTTSEMTIIFTQHPYRWEIDVKNSQGIRCRDVFQAIYDTFQEKLTWHERRLFLDHPSQADDEALLRYKRADSGQPEVEPWLRWKRVDVLAHKTIFLGLTQTKPAGDLVLNLGRPEFGFTPGDSSQTNFPSSSRISTL